LNEVGDPGLLLALQLHRAQLPLARARHAASNEASRARDEVAQLARHAHDAVDISDDARFALRILERELRRATLVWDASSQSLQLANGDVVELASRPQLARLLVALVDRRISSPGAPLTLDDVLEACWPGEKMSATAAQNRVKVALSTLRKMGLRDLIQHHPDGWMLDPSLPLFRK
jgi:hypothetical protein